MTLAEFPRTWLVGAAIVLGLLFGSFLNVVIHRLPRGQSIVFPPSSCPACGARIRALDNVPVLGWLALRGKARCCGAPISARYPVVESLGGLLGWGVMQGLVLNLPGSTPLHWAALSFVVHFSLTLGLLAALFIDLEHMILPDALTLGGAALGLLSLPLREITLSDALLGGVIGFLMVWLPFDVLYRKLRGHRGMGLGDAKLLLLAGVWFGWPGAVFALLAGSIQGTLVTVVLLLTRGHIEEPEAVRREREELHRELETLSESERAEVLRELDDDVLAREPGSGLGQIRLPFGPFLILSLFELLFFGGWLEQQFVEFLWPL